MSPRPLLLITPRPGHGTLNPGESDVESPFLLLRVRERNAREVLVEFSKKTKYPPGVFNLKSAIGQACHPNFLQCDGFENPLHDIDLTKSLSFLNENRIMICMNIEHRELNPKDLTEVD